MSDFHDIYVRAEQAYRAKRIHDQLTRRKGRSRTPTDPAPQPKRPDDWES